MKLTPLFCTLLLCPMLLIGCPAESDSDPQSAADVPVPGAGSSEEPGTDGGADLGGPPDGAAEGQGPMDEPGGPPSRGLTGTAPTGDSDGQGPLERLLPGTFQIIVEPKAQPTVYSPFEVALGGLDDEVGERIGEMYEQMEGKGWKKTGPAMVAVRGARDGKLVQAEVTFTLAKPAQNAAKAKLKAGELPGGEMAVTVHAGNRNRLPETDVALDKWMKAEGRKARGDLRWYVFLNRPDQVTDEQLRTVLVQPVGPASAKPPPAAGDTKP